MNVVRKTQLSPPVMKTILAEKRYAERTGFRLPLRKPTDLENIKRLIEIKLAY